MHAETDKLNQQEAKVADAQLTVITGVIAPLGAAAKAATADAAGVATVEITSGNVFRSASGTPASMTPRAADTAGLSAANSLENALPGKIQIIDVSKLSKLCAVCDNLATGHVSIMPKDMGLMGGGLLVAVLQKCIPLRRNS
ncbi:MAG TPA: hypothetical protein VNZ85_06985 [Caulobacter sp.]|nr:hypothetical protein [Caulobacter sp.]